MVLFGSHAFPGLITVTRGIEYMYGSVPATCPTRPHEMGKGQFAKEINNGKMTYRHLLQMSYTISDGHHKRNS